MILSKDKTIIINDIREIKFKKFIHGFRKGKFGSK